MVKQLFVVSALFCVVVLFKEVSSLRCWVCQADSSQSQYGVLCNDKFDSSVFTEDQRRMYFTECPSQGVHYDPLNPNQQTNLVPACKKIKQRAGSSTQIVRSCTHYNRNEPRNKCMNDRVAPGVTIDFCEVCENGDGCNSAGQYGPIAILVALSVLLAKLLAL